jgi:DnaJ-class molecular chaperone
MLLSLGIYRSVLAYRGGTPESEMRKPVHTSRIGNTMAPKIKEHTCAACGGTGFPVVVQPIRPTRKIYPVRCKVCEGKGRITDAN